MQGDNSNSTGTDCNGGLSLHGKLKGAITKGLHGHDLESDADLGMFFRDEADWTPQPVMLFEIAAKREPDGPRRLTSCLALEKCENVRNSYYRRVGALALQDVNWFDETESVIIKIV